MGRIGVGAGLWLSMVLGTLPALAAPIANPVATFSGLDKITARITNFDVYINETVQFGSLQITPRVCYTRPPDEPPRTSVFVEVDQVSLHGGAKRLFTGWMFADSPALNAIDDAVYDVWLVDCRQHSDTPPPASATIAAAPAAKPATVPETPAAAPAAPAAAAASTPGSGDTNSIINLTNPNPTAETSPDAPQ